MTRFLISVIILLMLSPTAHAKVFFSIYSSEPYSLGGACKIYISIFNHHSKPLDFISGTITLQSRDHDDVLTTTFFTIQFVDPNKIGSADIQYRGDCDRIWYIRLRRIDQCVIDRVAYSDCFDVVEPHSGGKDIPIRKTAMPPK